MRDGRGNFALPKSPGAPLFSLLNYKIVGLLVHTQTQFSQLFACGLA